MALSDEHIKQHLVEWTDLYLDKNDTGGGGHSGMSLNIFCGLLQEPPEQVARLALSITNEVEAPAKWVYGLLYSYQHQQYMIYDTSDYDSRRQYFLPGGYDPWKKIPQDQLKTYTYKYFRPNT